MAKRYFTSEAVGMGHPDKLADRISDSVLDACLAQDSQSRVACETLVTTGLAVVAGEITTNAHIEYQQVVREAIKRVGYTNDDFGINGSTCAVMVALDRQSPDIAMGVNASDTKDVGAGDQGLMFGYACNQTPELMPLPIALAHRITNRLCDQRFNKVVDWLRPDAKSQVTVEYDGDKPVRIDTVVVSTQHNPDVDQQTIHDWIIANTILPSLPEELIDDKIKYFINPTGNFVVGGPQGDCGLTGRKIIVDTYGGWARHGGGAFSGKDPTKVDRSAAYMARYIAKNVVAAELADQCEVQLSYAIGVSEPTSVLLDLHGTGKVDEDKLSDAIRDLFPLTPRGLVDALNLRRPIFEKTSFGGHFGRSGDLYAWEKNVGVSTDDDAYFTWEKTDKAQELAKLL
ncbi:MAG: methionine adenosyltransferase [Planctomycetia bacterium]|nr:methionine adenosyltransferase [Planctomycetia bacterium]